MFFVLVLCRLPLTLALLYPGTSVGARGHTTGRIRLHQGYNRAFASMVAVSHVERSSVGWLAIAWAYNRFCALVSFDISGGLCCVVPPSRESREREREEDRLLEGLGGVFDGL